MTALSGSFGFLKSEGHFIYDVTERFYGPYISTIM